MENLYQKYNLIPVKSKLAKNENEAIKFASLVGFPVALKIESPDILHKTDIGGVELNLYSEREVEKAYYKIISSVKSKKSNANIKGVLIQEMLLGGFELILGYNNDPVFGPTIMLGMGGIFTEVFKDIVFRALPIAREDAKQMIRELKYSNLILDGYRGIPPVSQDMLIEVIIKVSQMAMDLFPNMDSFDINPIIVWGDQYRIVDFKYVPSNKVNKIRNGDANTKNLDHFFNAKSVAVIGASGSSREKLGNYILDSLAFHDYKGKVYPVNPKYENIMGIKAYSSILDIPDKVELVVISIPLSGVPDILEQCSKKDIHNVVIISGGGKETGERELEEKIRNTAKKFEIRIIGCNCVGVFDGFSRLDTFFQTHDRMSRPKGGSISIISQSGTVGLAFLELVNMVGVSKFISYGNRIDVDEGDLIEYLGNDSKTKVIAAYIEGLDNGRKFFDSAKKISSKKPVVVYKAGRTLQASRASVSHTGFLSGTYNIIKGVFNQTGIISVDSFDGLVAATKTLSMQPKANGDRILSITNGAGTIIQAIDRIDKNAKLKLAKLSSLSKEKLKEQLSSYVVIKNPVDLTGSATDKDYESAINVALEDQDVDIIMVWFVFQDSPVSKKIYSTMGKLSRNSKKPIICGAIGGDYTYYIGDLIEKEGIPVFYSVEEWVTAAEVLSIAKL